MNEKRLLVIDDDPLVSEYVRVVAETMGYEVRVTSEPKEFKKAYSEIQPTHIVLDMVMPEEDGLELLQELATRRCESQLVVVSAYSNLYLDLAKRFGAALGLNKVKTISKPFQLQELTEALT